jgi:hypothetical protein
MRQPVLSLAMEPVVQLAAATCQHEHLNMVEVRLQAPRKQIKTAWMSAVSISLH